MVRLAISFTDWTGCRQTKFKSSKKLEAGASEGVQHPDIMFFCSTGVVVTEKFEVGEISPTDARCKVCCFVVPGIWGVRCGDNLGLRKALIYWRSGQHVQLTVASSLCSVDCGK